MSNESMNLYVSPAGNDRWSGTIPAPAARETDGPLASVAGARDAIRRMSAKVGLKGGVTVQVQAGV